MRHLRLRLTPGERTIHPLFTLVADHEVVSSAQMVNWNIANADHPTLLFAIEGYCDEIEAALANLSYIVDYEIIPIDDFRFYLYIQPEPTILSERLFDMYSREDVIVVHPVVYSNGSARVNLLGDTEHLQAALADFSAGLNVTVEQVGDFHTSPETIAARLSPRQREAVEIALESGYYEHPRRATHADIAEQMGCAPNTASVHLQKAEAKILSAVMG
jgi:predicted DNA binding protein